MALAHSPSIVMNGLVLCLDAGNVKSYPGSGTVWNDISGNGYGVTLTNIDGSNFNSSNGGYLTFNGVDEEATINISNFFTSYSQQITMETWVYIPSSATWSNGFFGGIFTRGAYDGSHGLWRTTNNNEVSFYCRQAVTFATQESRATISRDTWYHLVGVWDAGTKLYVNGTLADSDSAVFTGDTENSGSFGVFEMGRVTAAGGANGNRFLGNQSSAKIYNRALTAAEVQQNFNALRGRYGI